MNVAGAIVAPMAMAASALLHHPVFPHAIAAPRRVFCSSSLGRISYYEDGAASGLPVVLLHDVGAPANGLGALFEELRGERPLVVPDLPGHGFSQRRKTPLTRDEYVRFVEDVVVDVSRRYGATIDVVAIGTTSEFTAEAVVRSSRHVRSLTLIAPTGFETASWLVRRRQALLSRATFGWTAALNDPNVVAGVYDALRVPTCFLHGTETSVPRAEIDLLGGGHTTFRRSEILGAHGAPHVERADATADALRAFWRTLSVKPELRLIRGEKSERSVTSIRRGSPSAARRRSWT